MIRGKKGFWCAKILLLFVLIAGAVCLRVQGAEEEKIEFFYENVCASCEGDADFFRLYEECLTKEERARLQGRVVTYNVFLDSCREHYKARGESLGIPSDTQLPVLIVGGKWVSGLENMEELLHEAAEEAGEAPLPKEASDNGIMIAGQEELSQEENWSIDAQGAQKSDAGERENGARRAEEATFISGLKEELEDGKAPAVLLFTTESCDDCDEAKEWLSAIQEESEGGRILTCNIIKDPCVDFLRAMFRQYGVKEQDQKVPALFYGKKAVTGAGKIGKLTAQELWSTEAAKELSGGIRQAGKEWEKSDNTGSGRQSLLTLAGAGLLAGLNPCSISMLLMLLSMIVAEKASVWKNGLLYLCGKYAAYFSIGLVIYVSASGLDGSLLQNAGQILNKILVILFVVAGILYLIDAVRVFKQDYGKIRTQLPGGLRKWNHRLIRRVGSYTGVLRPLLILGLGMAISVGEFFCTGQIYMASITYLLREQVSGVWLYFLVYVTAMSFPAFLMLIVIQRTRNTEHISEFMLRHLGAVKIFNALLFFAFAVYFLLQ